jgi:hypothetical protein
MKTDVDQMESEMLRLTSNIEAITAKSDQINTALSDRRARIEQLNGVRAASLGTTERNT